MEERTPTGVRSFFCPDARRSRRLPFATLNPAADGRPVRIRRGIAMGIGASLLGLAGTSAAVPTPAPTDWQKTISPLPRGDFPNPRSLVATYHFGWTGLVAATGEV